MIIYTFRKPHPLVGHGVARGALALTRLHVLLFSNSGWLSLASQPVFLFFFPSQKKKKNRLARETTVGL